MSFLSLSGIEKTFPDGTHAVRGIDLAFEEGEFIVLLGPSGCGKTTTLRMIAGLEQPSAGRIELAGRDVTSLRPAERDVGFVFQFYALYPHMRVRENILFPLECAGVSAPERRVALELVTERLELDELLFRYPRELSGGDQQRVALARAMVRRPAVYLMDEPLGTLDADRRLAMCEFLRTQQIELGVTTVYVTHDQEEALRLADRIVVMSGGRILQTGPPSEVYDDPSSLFVARFVGSPGMNFIRGEVRAEGGASVFVPAPEGPRPPAGETDGEAGGFDADPGKLRITLLQDARPGPAVLGVRPEFVRVEPGPIGGLIVADEYLGASRCLHVDTVVGRLIARTSPDEDFPVGETIELAFDPEHVRLFDHEGGERIA